MAVSKKWVPVYTVMALMILGIFAQAQAQESLRRGDRFMCLNGSTERRVEVHYFEINEAVPCEVRYYKDTEEPGIEQVLWRAENHTGYCEDKSTTFVDQLSVWGWDCQLQADTPPDLKAGGTTALDGDLGMAEESGIQMQ